MRRKASGPGDHILQAFPQIQTLALVNLSHSQYLASPSIHIDGHSYDLNLPHPTILHLANNLKDISAKSPVISSDASVRQSLDSARLPRLPRSSIGERRFERQPPTAEEGFEDVGLNDEQNKPKREGFFSKFGRQQDGDAPPTTSRFHITGRKRGQSGQGAELGAIQRPGTAGSVEVQEVSS
jgi:hypothetical protein